MATVIYMHVWWSWADSKPERKRRNKYRKERKTIKKRGGGRDLKIGERKKIKRKT